LRIRRGRPLAGDPRRLQFLELFFEFDDDTPDLIKTAPISAITCRVD
jgi:hypothetical protein